MPQTPVFDPSKPFTPVVASGATPGAERQAVPTFDPSKSFQPAAGSSATAPSPEEMIAQQMGRQAFGYLGLDVDGEPASVVGNAMLGALKGLGHTAESLGKLPHLIPGVSALVDRMYGPGASASGFANADRLTTPSNTSQHVGYGAEQVAELIVPGSKVGKASEVAAAKLAPKLAPIVGKTVANLAPRMAVEAAGGAGMSAVQGGDAGAGAALGAAGPVVSAGATAIASRVAPALKEAAQKSVVQALGPTKERFKAMAEKIAPEILKRGLGGSRKALQELAETTTEELGPKIDDAIQQFADRKVTTQPVLDALEDAKDAFRTSRTMSLDDALKEGVATRQPARTVNTGVLDSSGKPVTRTIDGGITLAKGATLDAAGNVVKETVFEPTAVRQLAGLQQIITDLGPDARVDQLVAVRRAWDKVVAQAGGFAQRAPGGIGIPLKDASEAAVKRTATNAIRAQLNEDVPELSKLNKEYSFWKSLDDVLTQTLQRTQPQGKGIGRIATEAAGQAVGAAAGSSGGPVGALGGAAIVGKLADTAKAVFSSPRWKFINAKLKDQLADAIASGSVGQMQSAIYRISAVQASKFLPVTAGGG